MTTKKSSGKKSGEKKLKSKTLKEVRPLSHRPNGAEGPCYVGSVVFGEDFETGPRVVLVRRWLVEKYEPSGRIPQIVMSVYRKHGETAARIVERSRILKTAFRKLFDRALAKAEAEYQQ